MIHFIFGLPGTGKTSEITNRIQADIRAGKNVLLIVPEQQTVEAERTMLKLLPPQRSCPLRSSTSPALPTSCSASLADFPIITSRRA